MRQKAGEAAARYMAQSLKGARANSTAGCFSSSVMRLTVTLLAALPARADGLGACSAAEAPFRPRFAVQCSLLGPDGQVQMQRTPSIVKKTGGGGASGGNRQQPQDPQCVQPLGQRLVFVLPAAGSRCGSSCSSREDSCSGGRSRLGSPAGSFGGGGGGGGSGELRAAAERAATELRFAVLGKLSDMTTDVLLAQGSITLSEVPVDGSPHPASIPMRR